MQGQRQRHSGSTPGMPRICNQRQSATVEASVVATTYSSKQTPSQVKVTIQDSSVFQRLDIDGLQGQTKNIRRNTFRWAKRQAERQKERRTEKQSHNYADVQV